MKLTDLHCDTLYRMAKENLTIDDHSLHIHRRTIDAFDDVWQVFALWSDRRVDDHTAWVELKERYALLKSLSLPSHLTPLLAVEDARLLEGDLTRLCELKAMGFLMLGFFWSGENQLGTAHDCPHRGGLTSFGYQVLQNCFSLGICPDISHASFDSAEDMIRLAEAQKMPLCASHSAFFGVHPHTRNITDEHAKRVAQLGGAVGLCFVPAHLGDTGLEKVAAHIRHGVSLVGEEGLCLGCDFDGTDHLPLPIENQAHLLHLADYLQKEGFSPRQIDLLFWRNGRRFLAPFLS